MSQSARTLGAQTTTVQLRSADLTGAAMEISHSNLTAFAADRVNLPADRAQNHRDQVNRLRDRLQAKIDDDPSFALVKMLHAGSVAKGTGLRTVDDLDVAVYVRRTDVPSQDDRELVSWLADRLDEANPNMSRDQFIEQQHTVKIEFRGTGLDVDVVPVLYDGADDDRGDLINRNTGERVETSVKLHLQFIRSRKAKYGPQYAELIRLTKWWKRHALKSHPDLRMKSFIIELIWAHLAENGTSLSDYPEALESFFVHLVKRPEKPIAFTDFGPAPSPTDAPMQIIDPVNPDNNIAKDYTINDRNRISDAAMEALSAIQEARFAPTKGRELELWQRIFGSSFRG